MPSKHLTPRERQVLRLLATGLSPAEVGERLYIGKRSVDFHCHNAYRKFEVKSLLQVLNAAQIIKVVAA